MRRHGDGPDEASPGDRRPDERSPQHSGPQPGGALPRPQHGGPQHSGLQHGGALPSPPPGQPAGAVRRAVLSDVPALARLVREPASALLVGDDLSPDRRAVVLRLVLTHVGLDAGELWVRADAAGRLQSAAALLPPRADRADQALLLALHLGGSAAPSAAGGSPPVLGLADDHWFLLPTAPDPALLAVALRGVDERGACTFTVSPAPDPALAAAGFRPAGADGVLVRPATVRPVRALEEPRVLTPGRAGRRPGRLPGRSGSGVWRVAATLCGAAGEAQVRP